MTTVNQSENPFIKKLFDRVHGLLAVLVTDDEGTIILKGLAPNLSSLTKVDVKDFDNAFPATFLLASEQASKLPFGTSEHLISFYDDFVVVQMNTAEPTNESPTSPASNNLIANDSTNNNMKQDESDGEEILLNITLIANQETSIQLLLNLAPQLKQLFANL